MLLGHEDKTSTGKEVLNELGDPVAKMILNVRGDVKLLGTYIDKMPKITGPDSRIHCQFKSVGAATGRMASADPNLQNIPSRKHDIRHMFRATPALSEKIEVDDNIITLREIDSINTKQHGWIYVKDASVGDTVTLSEGAETCDFKIVHLDFIEDILSYRIELEQLYE